VGACYFLLGLLYALVGYQYKHLLRALAWDVSKCVCCRTGRVEDGTWSEDDEVDAPAGATSDGAAGYHAMDGDGATAAGKSGVVITGTVNGAGGEGGGHALATALLSGDDKRKSAAKRRSGKAAPARPPLTSAALLSQSGVRKRAVYIMFALLCMLVASLFVIRAVLFLYAPASGHAITGLASEVLYPEFFYV
jgi:hypothetical protein